MDLVVRIPGSGPTVGSGIGGGGGGGGATFILVSKLRFRRFYKLIFEIVFDMHCIFI